MPRYIKIRESHRGLSASSNYYFVVDGPILRYISEYAVERSKVGDTAEYLVDLDKIRDKLVVEVLASNSGIICSASVFRAEDLLLDALERPEERVELSYLNKFHFSFLRPWERTFLENEWKKYYIPMLLELKSFVNRLEATGTYVTMPKLLDCQIRSEAMYPLSYLIPYSDKARAKSLEGLTKFVHQAWVVLKLVKGLRSSVEPSILGKYMPFEQSSQHPIFIYRFQGNVYSVWWEFDLNPMNMCGGIWWYSGIPPVLHNVYERASQFIGQGSAPLRPDIVVLRNAQSCDDILKRGLDVMAVFECKDQDYGFWADKIATQVKPYAEIFKPVYTFLVSMKPVPNHVQRGLEKYGVTVVDNAHPGGEGERKLVELARYLV